jgi:hypothetical protein
LPNLGKYKYFYKYVSLKKIGGHKPPIVLFYTVRVHMLSDEELELLELLELLEFPPPQRPARQAPIVAHNTASPILFVQIAPVVRSCTSGVGSCAASFTPPAKAVDADNAATAKIVITFFMLISIGYILICGYPKSHVQSISFQDLYHAIALIF